MSNRRKPGLTIIEDLLARGFSKKARGSKVFWAEYLKVWRKLPENAEKWRAYNRERQRVYRAKKRAEREL